MQLDRFLFGFFVVFVIGFVSIGAEAQGQYDVDLTRERVRAVHGDFALKIQGDWRASLEGRIEQWRWNGQEWRCGTKTEPLSCEPWKVNAFEVLGKSFWQVWSPVKRLSFDVIKAKVEAPKVKVQPVESSETENGDVSSPEAAHTTPIWSKNIIGEQWLWNNSKSEELKILISARDSRIERIDFGGQTEVFEWVFLGSKKTLDLSKVILEKNGIQVVLTKVK